MIVTRLARFYSPLLVGALLAPLWFAVLTSSAAEQSAQLRDAVVWSGILIGLWLLTRLPRYQILGEWRSPAKTEATRYWRCLLIFMLVDFGSKALFFDWQRPWQVEIFNHFGLHSVFHVTPFEPFHVHLLLYSLFMFLLGPLFFRFANKELDRIWMISSAITLAGVIPLVSERFLFGGVHDSFYFSGPLMLLCPTCYSPHFISYAWTPADFFVHAGIMPSIVTVVSYLARPKNRAEQRDGIDRLQDEAASRSLSGGE